ncbi:unnamed protein product [Parascedosporium putredinis]|uniref:MFS transporter n=1 Tax=Parascedosporium putredinis TaxID=1442378 RepID=A0A9P1GYT5_9PEZI|nr:unnamed protein product [Parascedosporium putredinis]CAI7992149.1 unnamed protein product [Parascedosporium putredinis]
METKDEVQLVEESSSDALRPTLSSVTLDPAAEAAVRKKLDWRIMPIVVLIYLFAFIDRTNAGNARVLGMDEDLHLDGFRFNISLTAFYVPYILFEVPANMLCKAIGPKIWIPALTASFGIVVLCMSMVSTYEAFIATRVVLGFTEAGMSKLGPPAHSAASSPAPSPKSPWGPLHTWRNIFFFEGLLSLILGLTAYFLLPDSPATAAFLSPNERALAAARIADDLGNGGRIEGLEAKYVRRAVCNPNTALVALASLCSLTSMNSMALFVPSILRAMGHSGARAQLLSAPPYAWAAVVCVSASALSDRMRTRGFWVLAVMPFSVVGFGILALADPDRLGGAMGPGLRYFALFLCLTGVFTASPVLLAWAVENSAGHTTRAVVAASVVGFGSTGGVVAAWTYLLPDAPGYIKGHVVNLASACVCIVAVVAAMWRLDKENQFRKAGDG